ncbi:MAG TPA: hypothetical protein VGD07_18640 [Methylomirabilota bacterium]
MGHNARVLFVAALVLLAAGVAAANHPLLNARPPGLAMNGSLTEPSSSPPPTITATADTSTAPPGATAPSTNGTTTSPSLLPPTGTTTTATDTLAIDRIVSITRTVEAGVAAVDAFTVPAGRQLVVTDVVVTNPGTAPACGASVSPGGNGTPANGTTGNGTPGTPASGPPTAARTALATGESGTGLLCVPAQTSLNLGLSTGLEFAAGQSVLLSNTLPAAATTPAGPLHYHLRGFLVTPAGA